MNDLLARLERGELSAAQAIAALVAAGHDRGFAEEAVFVTLGGSDLVEVGDDGRERYVPSGKLVREVNEAMRR